MSFRKIEMFQDGLSGLKRSLTDPQLGANMEISGLTDWSVGILFLSMTWPRPRPIAGMDPPLTETF